MSASFTIERSTPAAQDSLVVNEHGAVDTLCINGRQIFGNTSAMSRLTQHNGLGDQLDGEVLGLHFKKLDSPQRLYSSMQIGNPQRVEVVSQAELIPDGFRVVRSVRNLHASRPVRAEFPVVAGIPLSDEERHASFKLRIAGREPIVLDPLEAGDERVRSHLFIGAAATIDLGGRQMSVSSQTIFEGSATRPIQAPEGRLFVQRESDALYIGPAACDGICEGLELRPSEALITGATFTFDQA